MAVTVAASLFAQPCHSLFFSEYVEGSSNNKALEIYNPTSAPVSLFGYKVVLYSNGQTTASSTLNLNATIAAGDVYVIANGQADTVNIKPKADTTSGVTNFNGDDAVVLLYGTDTIDIIGIFGNDPGAAWNVGTDTNGTLNHTLIRKSTVMQGVNPWDTTQWLVLPQDSNRLSAHTGPTGLTPCSVLPQDTVAVFSPTSGNFTGVNGNYNLRVQLNLPHSDSLNVDVELASGNAAWINNYTTQTVGFGTGITQKNLALTITNDTTGGASHVLTFRLINASTGLVIGTDSIFTLTLTPPTVVVVVTDSCATLFFSEYVEGSANNKALEIYNPMATAIDMAGYKVKVFSNGNPAPSNTFNLSGVLAAGDVYVIGGSQSNDSIKAYSDTLITSVTNFNGNDALVLFYGDDTLDIIGILGDTVTSWNAGSGNTLNHTLVRDPLVKKGNNNWAIATGQWISLAQDSIQLGRHTGPTNEAACALDPIIDGISETGAKNISRIYPNPNNGNFIVEVNTIGNTGAEVKMFDLAGRMVYYTKETTAKMNISANGLLSGMYIVEVKTGDSISRTRVSVQ